MNPAVTLAFARLQALPRTDVAGYVAGQMLGSVVGVILARVVWARAVASRAVSFGAIKPGGGHHAAEVFVVEAVSLMVLMIVTTFFLARPRLARWSPVAAGSVVAILIAATGTTTGGSFNPARAFGPALLSAQTAYLWCCYLLAPMVGAVFAAWITARSHAPAVLTCPVCGTSPTTRARGAS
jgi:glycerol uptake facilitator-like aquaporin